MNVFDLRHRLVSDYARYTRSFIKIADSANIMDTFPIVKRKDEAKFNGDYRTKRTSSKSTTRSQEPSKPAVSTKLDSIRRRQMRGCTIHHVTEH